MRAIFFFFRFRDSFQVDNQYLLISFVGLNMQQWTVEMFTFGFMEIFLTIRAYTLLLLEKNLFHKTYMEQFWYSTNVLAHKKDKWQVFLVIFDNHALHSLGVSVLFVQQNPYCSSTSALVGFHNLFPIFVSEVDLKPNFQGKSNIMSFIKFSNSLKESSGDLWPCTNGWMHWYRWIFFRMCSVKIDLMG